MQNQAMKTEKGIQLLQDFTLYTTNDNLYKSIFLAFANKSAALQCLQLPYCSIISHVTKTILTTVLHTMLGKSHTQIHHINAGS